jgi:hypothetical protein
MGEAGASGGGKKSLARLLQDLAWSPHKAFRGDTENAEYAS